MRASRLLFAVATIGTVLVPAAAGAVTFNLINTGGAEVGTQARAGFQAAANYWSSMLTNNSSVNLEIGFESLGKASSAAPAAPGPMCRWQRS